jgi:hypothetical protein
LETPETRRATSSTIPFGWAKHPRKKSVLIAKAEEQEALSYIRERRDNLSLKQMADVLHARTGRRLTKRGVKKVLDRKY